MAIVLNGAITLNRVSSRTRTTTITDGGTMEPVIGLVAETAERWHTLAQAREIERQLHEIAWYSRNSGGIYVDSDEFAIDDGLYEIVSIETQTDPVTFGGAATIRCSLDLRRIGGGPVGGNLVQRVYASSSLQANSYSITSTPIVALPVDATSLDVGASSNRSSKDGTVPCYLSGPTYTFGGADYNKGECKIYDTTGSGTEANWLRVWSPDHVFADPSHLVIENGLLRIQGITGGNNGSHRYYVWTGAAYTEVTESTLGDGTTMGGTVVTDTYDRITLDEVAPWRVKVTLRSVHSTAPQFLTKSITLERGHPLARVALSTVSTTNFRLGIRNGRWVFTKGSPLSGGDMQRPARDDTEETGAGGLNAPEDNWIACFTTKSSSTGTLGIAAWADSALDTYAPDGGGCYVENDIAATSLTVYLGGVKYDTSSAQLEAEAGTLTGGAVTSATVAGASGSGNDQVTLNATNARVDMLTNLASIGGSSILILFRIACSQTTDSLNILTLEIRNETAGTAINTVNRDPTHFAAANTWYWQAVVGSGWNGTDAIRARVTYGFDNGADFYVDQSIPVAISGSTSLMQVDDMAAQALTETIAWPVALAAVR